MRRVSSFYQSPVIKKFLMALTGFILFGFVVIHMVGNLKIYLGAEHYDEYAHWLREMGAPALGHEWALWATRAVLLLCVGLHGWSAWQVYRLSKSARPVPYKKNDDQSFSYASGTMRWGGVVLLLFVIYHLMHLTLGTFEENFTTISPYRNVVAGFQVWWISAIYIVAMLPLGLHIYHGLWSATQTLSLRLPKYKSWRRPLAAGIALLIVVGNISIPVAVLAGLLS